MKSPPLTGSHRRTYKAIFQHPIANNLEWRSVYGLLDKLGHVTEEPNGNLTATRNGLTLVLNPSRTKDVAEEDEVVALRHFLEQSEEVESQPETGENPPHWILVIDHHEARILRSEMRAAILQRLLPHDPDDFFRHAQNSRSFSLGKEKPDPNSYFEPVAVALKDADRILIFGTGTGMSSEMDQFIAWLKVRYPDIAGRINGSLVVDLHHLTEAQLLARARAFYANPPPAFS